MASPSPLPSARASLPRANLRRTIDSSSRRDADAAILHLDDDVLSIAPRRNADEALARRVADGVVDQVVERQHHRRAVGPDERQVDRHVDFDRELALGQRMPEVLQHIVHQLRRRNRLERIHLGDVGHARVREQVVDQPRQPPSLPA